MESNYIYVITEHGVLEAYEYLKTLPYIGIDTETTSLDALKAIPHSIQLGDERKQFVLDYQRTKDFIKPILDLLTSHDVPKVGQNLKYDYKIIKSTFGVTMNAMWDTMLAEQILINGRSYGGASLEDLADKYLGVKLYKNVRASFIDHAPGQLLSDDQLDYGAKDVVVLMPILKKQLELIRKYGLSEVFKLECETIKPTAEMELNGFYLDSALWMEAYKDADKKREKSREHLLTAHFADICEKDLFGNPSINLNSPKQLLPALIEISGIKLDGTSAPVLQKHKGAHKVFSDLLEYRSNEKLCSTYGINFLDNIHPVTGRIHSTYSQLYPVTGRYSSKDPNLQNIPAITLYRRCFRPEDPLTTTMYTADYSGCELRILAELSNDAAFRKIFTDGLDAHRYVGNLVTGVPYEEIDDPTRKKCKALNFGIPYGMGPKKLADRIDVSMDEARALLKAYFDAFPGIKMFLDSMATYAKNNRKAICPLDGRLQDLGNVDWDNPKKAGHAINVAKNMPFQGGNASMIKRGMCILYDKIEKHGRHDLKLVTCVHDEFVVEGDRDKAEEGKQIVHDAMIEAGEYYVKSVPMEVTLNETEHWQK